MRKIFTCLILCLALPGLSAQDLLYLDATGVNANLTIQSGASVYVQGGYVANASAKGMEVDGDLYIGDGTSGATSNWSDNMASSSVLSTSTGKVHFQSNLTQNITGTNTVFYNIHFNNTSANTSGVQLLSGIKVSNQADFTDGVVYANSNTLYINTTSATAIIWSAGNTSTYSNSWVAASYPNGKLDRDMTNSASVYDFPVGSSSYAQLLQVTPTNITGISRLSASWESPVAGFTPIGISECGTFYTQVNSGGEWHLRPANGGIYGIGSFASGNMTLRGWRLAAFPGIIDNQFGILQRAEGNITPAGWSVPSPSCTSLAAFGASGRTIAGDNALRNSLSAYSDATSQLGIGMTMVILPIQLLSFTGWNSGDVNDLAWATSSEINTDYFDLQRSLEGINYQSIGQLTAAGNSSHELNYNFTDEKPSRDLNYYRLKMVDRDHSFTYSNIVLIQLGSNGTVNTVISPNPTFNNINIQLQSDNGGAATVQLTDALGRVLQTNSWQLVTGANFTSINTNGLPAAMYFVKIYLPANLQETYKVVKEN